MIRSTFLKTKPSLKADSQRLTELSGILPPTLHLTGWICPLLPAPISRCQCVAAQLRGLQPHPDGGRHHLQRGRAAGNLDSRWFLSITWTRRDQQKVAYRTVTRVSRSFAALCAHFLNSDTSAAATFSSTSISCFLAAEPFLPPSSKTALCPLWASWSSLFSSEVSVCERWRPGGSLGGLRRFKCTL